MLVQEFIFGFVNITGMKVFLTTTTTLVFLLFVACLLAQQKRKPATIPAKPGKPVHKLRPLPTFMVAK